MTEELLELVTTEALPALSALGFTVVESETSESFDNSSVVLQAAAMRIRIVRERSEYFLDIGPASEPATWFDSALVVDYLGLSASGGIHGRDGRRALLAITEFITTMWNELMQMFGSPRIAVTRQQLKALAEARARRRSDY